VESVLADVPRADRCRCREGGPKPKAAAPKTAASKVAAAEPEGALGRFRDWLKK